MNLVDMPKQKPMMTKTEIENFLQLQVILAKANMTYYKTLLEEGFTETQALDLVKTNKYF